MVKANDPDIDVIASTPRGASACSWVGDINSILSALSWRIAPEVKGPKWQSECRRRSTGRGIVTLEFGSDGFVNRRQLAACYINRRNLVGGNRDPAAAREHDGSQSVDLCCGKTGDIAVCVHDAQRVARWHRHNDIGIRERHGVRDTQPEPATGIDLADEIFGRNAAEASDLLRGQVFDGVRAVGDRKLETIARLGPTDLKSSLFERNSLREVLVRTSLAEPVSALTPINARSRSAPATDCRFWLPYRRRKPYPAARLSAHSGLPELRPAQCSDRSTYLLR